MPDNPLDGIKLPEFLGGRTASGKRSSRVAVAYRADATAYPDSAPFDPTEEYSEYPYDEPPTVAANSNEAYALVRDALKAWNPAGYGSRTWNPLASTIRSGDTVLIKPNFVWEGWWNKSWVGVSTSHASTLRAVIDYVYKACGKSGRIVVGDGTANTWAWPVVIGITQTDKLIDHLQKVHGVPVQLIDLNDTAPNSTPRISLAENSAHYGLDQTLYDLHDKPDWHSANFGPGTYYVSPAVFQADVIVSLGKMKVHRMAGISGAMKNLFGIIPSWDGPYGDDRLKDVPHYSSADKKQGDAGVYPGNDTLWRTIADLNRIALYSDQSSYLQKSRRRRYLGIVDGLLAAGHDMLNPLAAPCKALVIGEDPVSVDAIVARIMGYDPSRIKSIDAATSADGFPLGPSRAGSIDVALEGAERLLDISNGSSIVAPDAGTFSWEGYIEASDFEAPVLRSARSEGSGIAVTLEDNSGVAFARIHYTLEGATHVRDMSLVSGDNSGGVWRTEIDPGSRLEDLVLETSDQMFNVATYRLGQPLT